ncbi:hypothetical protein [Amycolatopsis sp. NPDC051372]|uniref:hypothetical protein n=1 Tax=unclassified Amycolatopsis TaxID=2618356 RepID=UPI003413CC56
MINTLPKEDPEGVVPGLVVFVLMVAGYLGSTLAMQRTGTAAAHRRVAILTGYAVVASLFSTSSSAQGSMPIPMWGATSGRCGANSHWSCSPLLS